MYNSENFRKIKDEYIEKRHRAESTADMRLYEIHALSPEIAEIDEELRSTGLRIFRIACEGASGDEVREKIDALRLQNEQLVSDRREILGVLGYPSDYTDVKYECEKCNDTGYVETHMCDCMKKRLVKEGFLTSGLGYLIERQTFENFDLSYYNDSADEMSLILDNMKKYAQRFSDESDNLLFIGSTGLGKTHIASAIAKVVIENGYDVFYESVLNIISDFESEHFRGTATGARTDKYFDCDLLIIDDLGCEMTTQFSVSCIYNIINTRINKRKPTIISTNLSPEDIKEKYDARITSRLFGSYRPCMFKGEDVRIQKLGNRL